MAKITLSLVYGNDKNRKVSFGEKTPFNQAVQNALDSFGISGPMHVELNGEIVKDANKTLAELGAKTGDVLTVIDVKVTDPVLKEDAKVESKNVDLPSGQIETKVKGNKGKA